MNKTEAISQIKAHIAGVVAAKRQKGGSAVAGANALEAEWELLFARMEEQLTDADFADLDADVSMNELASYAIGELQ